MITRTIVTIATAGTLATAAAPAVSAPPRAYAQAMRQLSANRGIQQNAAGMFRTPSGNIFCSIGITNPAVGLEGCELRTSTIQATAAQCDRRIGRTTIGRVEVTRRGYRPVCNTDTIWQPGAPVLRYGWVSHVRGTPVYCLSTTAGLVCVNTRLKKGFFLSRSVFRALS